MQTVQRDTLESQLDLNFESCVAWLALMVYALLVQDITLLLKAIKCHTKLPNRINVGDIRRGALLAC